MNKKTLTRVLLGLIAITTVATVIAYFVIKPDRPWMAFYVACCGGVQSAFSEGGLPVGAGLEDLGKGLRSQVGTMFGTLAKGPRYLEMAEGYCTRMALDADDEVIGYEFIHLGKFMDMVKKGMDANEALEKAKGSYGRFKEAVKYIDPRNE